MCSCVSHQNMEWKLVVLLLAQGLGVAISSSLKFIPQHPLNVERNDETWLHLSGAFVYRSGQKYSTTDGTLTEADKGIERGQDKLGEFIREWRRLVADGINIKISERKYIRVGITIYGTEYLSTITDTSVSDMDKINTGWPCFKMAAGDTDKGFLSYGGGMFGSDLKIGRWDEKADIHSGEDGGPLVIFDRTGRAQVISTLSQFMITSPWHDKDNQELCYGIMGTVNTIEHPFYHETIVYEGQGGIQKVMLEWGEVLRFIYDKPSHYRDSDLTNTYLGFWTDGGAFYFYNTEPGKNYEETILEVKAYAEKENLPYKYVQYDSWWYYQDTTHNKDVIKWEPMPSVFPHGLGYMWNQTRWPASCHNRQWSHLTTYAKQNGGKYNFIVEDEIAIPQDKSFWEDLFNDARRWGLITYEQDHLNQQFRDCNATKSHLHVARNWLMQMGEAARKNGLTIQYCMSNPRHALQSVEIPVVTQARVSGDYRPGSDQWKIGIASIFAHSIAIAPFKDNFFTSDVYEPGNPYNMTETHPELQALIATLSMGPVAPSDKVGYTNGPLLMKCCNADGLILRPSIPALAINAQIHQAAWKDGSGPDGEVYTTHTQLGELIFGIIVAADMKGSFAMTPRHANFSFHPRCHFHGHHPVQFQKSVVFAPDWAMQGKPPQEFTEENPLLLTGCGTNPFCLYYVAPVLRWGDNEIVFAGELSKFVPVSNQRTDWYFIHDSGGAGVKISGFPGEVVSYWAVVNGKWSVFHCEILESGSRLLDFNSGCLG